LKEYGFAFLWTQRWAPSADPPVLGALAPIYGTLVTSFIAMLIAIPVGLGNRDLPHRDLPDLAAPSIGPGGGIARRHSLDHLRHVGFFVLGPFLANTFQPFMIRLFDGVPVLGYDFPPAPVYLSLFNAALILAIWCCRSSPRSRSTCFKTVPPVLEGSPYGVGCTNWEVVRNVVIPYTASGVIGRHHGWRSAARSARPCGDVHHRQLVPHLLVDLRAGHHDRGGDRLRICRSDGLHQSALILLGSCCSC